ncbi:MAG: 3-oxoacyl-[acyl-carrier-protein] synthase III C-terminal domain-containing protein [Anaerolineales bacterium]|jgi:3-oxoacyl-[acyl-carrier-protein] synthase III|nr:3-oxoacyl-[acyl-carrier-protein] synthase III C-terminal domain-containing protein [Anaerolineales bacterium]
MSENSQSVSFYDRPNVEKSIIPVAGGVALGMEGIYNSKLGIGGVYGSWGESYSNLRLPSFVEHRLGKPLDTNDILNLSELGFDFRQHIPDLNDAQHLELELEVGARLLRKALETLHWDASEVAGVLIGMSGPVSDDYVIRIAKMAGIPDTALKVSVHKACDGSMGALHLTLNPHLSQPGQVNIAEQLRGKKVLVGGIEGLSRFTCNAMDRNALQLFGNGMGVIGVIPGETMKFLVGKSFENYDTEGLLAVRMYYPHSHPDLSAKSLVDVVQENSDHIRIAGLMNEPKDGASIEMAGLMGMVKLFVRTGVQVVEDVYKEYHALMDKLGQSGHSIKMGIVHHANFKINTLKAKHLSKLGIEFPMPWLLSDFGNVSAASNMIAFLRKLQEIQPGDHILFDGFGAGTYYDVMAVSMG